MFWRGLVDEVAMVERPLSGSEIQAFYGGGLGKCKFPSAPFDFSISNSGDILTSPGASGSNTIIATLRSGASRQVVLSCASGLPLDASCSFSSNPVFPTSPANLIIATTMSTPTGSFTITVTGTGGGWTRTTQFLLVVSDGGGDGGGGGDVGDMRSPTRPWH